MHSSRMRTACALPHGRLPNRDHSGQRPPDRYQPGQRPPRQRPTWTETPIDRDPMDRDLPGHVTCAGWV